MQMVYENMGIQIFNNNDFGRIRTIQLNNEPWFVGIDVASALGYKDANKALKTHVDEEDKMGGRNATPSITDELGRQQHPTWINESGVYALIFGSKLESAKKFKHWVTSEILPAIRKNGSYEMPRTYSEALRQLADKAEEAEKLRLENDRMKPKEIFADAVATSDTSILIGELAKILKQNGVNIGQNRLFAWLREKGYLISRTGSDYNMPTQKAMDLKIFEIKERTINNPDGTVRITKTAKVTGKGQQYFINKFLRR